MVKFSDVPIRIKLIVTFILIGVLPLGVAGYYGHKLTTNSLLDKSFESLVTVQGLRKKQVENAFHRFLDDLKTLCSSQRLLNLNDELESYRKEKNVAPSVQFDVAGDRYEKIVEEYREQYLEFIETYGYHDMKIISSLTGHVMFTVTGEADLAANLIYGRYKDTTLTDVWRQVVETEKIAISDFAPHEPSGGMESLFVAAPLYNSAGAFASVVVLQLSPAFVNNIMDSRVGMGKTGESYLIRWFKDTSRFEFRSNIDSMGGGYYVVGYQLDRTMEYWHDAVKASFEGGHGLYRDSKEKEVLISYERVNFQEIDWYLISKIDKAEVLETINHLVKQALVLICFLTVFVIGCALVLSRRIVGPIIADVKFAQAISAGDLQASLQLDQKDELGILANSLNEMASNLRDIDWLKRGKEGLDDQLRGEHVLELLGERFISYVVQHVDGQLGAFYLFSDKRLKLLASYAFSDRSGNFNEIELGEGLIGQSALEQRMITFSNVRDEVPEFNYGVDQKTPAHFLVAPFILDGDLIGAFLIGSFSPFSRLHKTFIEQNLESASIFINMASTRRTIEELYEKGQVQQEELRVINEELEERTEALQLSQSELQAQQEELRVTNEDLQERTETLEQQKKILSQRTEELDKARSEIEKKAEELERGSTYKSEFLANMSHELRTPLNSILILSQILMSNTGNNLDSKQVDSAKAIHSSGSELLTLINEILDLSKVEAGKIELHQEQVKLARIVTDVQRIFKDIAEEKGLEFVIDIDPTLPESMFTDGQRVQQILRNLLTNAFKFTSKGEVKLSISRPQAGMVSPGKDVQGLMAFAVIDQGIGIAPEQQQEIFKAFQQADGSTSRTYGGTGLGLSISKELTRLLGGTIHLQSKLGKGSTFTIVLPAVGGDEKVVEKRSTESVDQAPKQNQVMVELPSESQHDQSPSPESLEDDRKVMAASDKSLLIIEDDEKLAKLLRDLARKQGFKCILAETGEQGLHFADYYRPSAIILAVGLPGIDGWEVMARLKESSSLRHIPVHFMSASNSSLDAMRRGAIGFLSKPVTLDKVEEAFHRIENVITKRVSRLLVVEDDPLQAKSIKKLIGNGDVITTLVDTGAKALEELKSGQYDCMVLDLGLIDMTGFELLDRMRECDICGAVPVIVYTGRDLTFDEEVQLRQYTESIIIKGVKSPERLLDESALFLHRVEKNLPDHQQETISRVRKKADVFADKTILVVDDDMRNVFALTSLLEERGVQVVVARDGFESLTKLEEHDSIDLVLMDIMMPKMDGFEAMTKIREIEKFKDLPIISLTAKAMKGDRAKCIDAGANDYLAKPVDNDKLISILKVWLY